MQKHLALLFAVLLLTFAHATPATVSSVVSKNTSFYPDDFIGAAKLASSSEQVKPENICISLGRFSKDPDWFLSSNGVMLRFTGEGSREISFLVYCDKGDQLFEAMKDGADGLPELEYVEHCDSLFNRSSEPHCAAVLSSVTSATGEQKPMPYIILISFAMLFLWSFLAAMSSEKMALKVVYLFKIMLFVIVLFLFNFFGTRETLFFDLVLLFFFFLQANISLAPFLLGFLENESKRTRLANFAILGIEFTIVCFVLIFIWYSGSF